MEAIAQYVSATPVIANGQQTGLFVDASGNLLVNLNAGGGTEGLATSANQTNGNQKAQVTSQGTTFTPPPSGWVGGSSDWVTGSTPALPANLKAIWLESTCSLKVDGGGQTGLVFNNIPGGQWWPVPPGVNISKIYTPANGSTGAVIDAVMS